MIKALKVRLYPNPKQTTLINKIIGCCRFSYNKTLSHRKNLWTKEHKVLSKYEAMAMLPDLKKQHPFLKEADSIALQNVLEHQQQAIEAKHFNIDKVAFKSKKRDVWSYTTKNSHNNIAIKDGYIKLPKLGFVKVKGLRPVNGTIKTATVTKTRSGKYMCSVTYETEAVKPFPKTGNTVGIDLGIESFITMSNGTKVNNPFYRNSSQDAIAFAQARLSRKQSGSKGYKKAQQRLAKKTEKVVNRRRDFLHKLSTQLVKAYDIIALEDLDVKAMMQKGSSTLTKEAEKAFHSRVADVSWFELVTMLQYKAEWYGKQVVQVDRYYPSSQLCSKCSYKNVAIKDLNVREWVCPCCGSKHERDVNAAVNIEAEGKRLLSL